MAGQSIAAISRETGVNENVLHRWKQKMVVNDAGGTLVEEWTTTPPMERNGLPTVATTSYVYAGSRLISTETSSGTTYVTLDHLGSTRVTTDGSGNVTSRKDFMAFGEEAISTQRNGGLGYGTPPSSRMSCVM